MYILESSDSDGSEQGQLGKVMDYCAKQITTIMHSEIGTEVEPKRCPDGDASGLGGHLGETWNARKEKGQAPNLELEKTEAKARHQRIHARVAKQGKVRS